jgi:hypothetical protein
MFIGIDNEWVLISSNQLMRSALRKEKQDTKLVRGVVRS